MPRPATIHVNYHGRHLTLSELSRETGFAYITLVRRWQAGCRDLSSLLRPTRRRESCTATHAAECYDCPHADCIRPAGSKLAGEYYPYHW
jgi:hypothetical protein